MLAQITRNKKDFLNDRMLDFTTEEAFTLDFEDTRKQEENQL